MELYYFTAFAKKTLTAGSGVAYQAVPAVRHCSYAPAHRLDLAAIDTAGTP